MKNETILGRLKTALQNKNAEIRAAATAAPDDPAGSIGVALGKAQGIKEIARIAHPAQPYQPSIARSLVAFRADGYLWQQFSVR
mgnify:CR=1 FL=1